MENVVAVVFAYTANAGTDSATTAVKDVMNVPVNMHVTVKLKYAAMVRANQSANKPHITIALQA